MESRKRLLHTVSDFPSQASLSAALSSPSQALSILRYTRTLRSRMQPLLQTRYRIAGFLCRTAEPVPARCGFFYLTPTEI